MKNLILLIVFLSFNTLNAQNSEPILRYEFQNSTEDISGNGNNAIENTVTYTTDRFGNENSAILFDGPSSILEMPISDLLLDKYSYSLWTKINAVPTIGNTQFLVSIGQIGGDQTIQVFNQGGSSNNLHGWYGGGYSTDGSILRIVDNQLPLTDEWYHIVLTRDVEQLKLYINCTLIDSLSTQTLPSYGTSSNYSAKLGGRFNLSESYHGIIDDFRIYNRILSLKEITRLCLYDTLSDQEIIQKSINVYPNPNSSGTLTVKSDNIEFDKLELFNAIGQKVLHTKTQHTSSYSLPIETLTAGIYLLKIYNNNSIIDHKRIIIIE